MTLSLENKIESLLFFKGEPLSVRELSKMLDVSDDEIISAIDSLWHALEGRGIVLLTKNDTYLLGTHPEMSEMIQQMRKQELEKDLGKAGLETLTIVLYRGPLTRADIDYIRGVNSNFIVRQLLVRGLIERIPNPQDQRSFLYQPTFDLLAFLGIDRVDAMPEYEKVSAEIQAFEHNQEQQENASESVSETAQDMSEDSETMVFEDKSTNLTETTE